MKVILYRLFSSNQLHVLDNKNNHIISILLFFNVLLFIDCKTKHCSLSKWKVPKFCFNFKNCVEIFKFISHFCSHPLHFASIFPFSKFIIFKWCWWFRITWSPILTKGSSATKPGTSIVKYGLKLLLDFLILWFFGACLLSSNSIWHCSIRTRIFKFLRWSLYGASSTLDFVSLFKKWTKFLSVSVMSEVSLRLFLSTFLSISGMSTSGRSMFPGTL